MLYETNGGATTSFGYEIELTTANNPHGAPVLVAKLYGAVRNDSAYGVNLRWATNSKLALEYLCAKSELLLRPKVEMGGRTVTVELAGGITDPAAPAGGMAYNGAKK